MKTIVLSGEKELRIFSLPLRQRILREMSRLGVPVTAKEIADRLDITPSSAQHHMKQLASIGLVEQDRTELIHGILAKYMRLTDVTVSIGQQYADDLSSSRDAVTRRLLMDAFDGYLKTVESARAQGLSELPGAEKYADVLSAVVHLTDEQAETLRDLVSDYLKTCCRAGENTHPWEASFLFYRMDLTEHISGGSEKK